MTILVVTKLLYVVYAYLSYKKGSIGDAQTIYGGTYAKKLP